MSGFWNKKESKKEYQVETAGEHSPANDRWESPQEEAELAGSANQDVSDDQDLETNSNAEWNSD